MIPTILLLPELGADIGRWQLTFDLLAKDCRIVVWDYWGFGESTKTLRSFIEEKQLRDFYLVGHSMGGAMVLDYLVFDPPKVRAAMVIAPTRVCSPHPWWQKVLMRIMSRGPLLNDLASGHLNQIKIPLTIVWGERDKVQPVQSALEMHRLLPSAQLTILTECGHFPMLECPEKFCDVVRHFLSGEAVPYEGCEDHGH